MQAFADGKLAYNTFSPVFKPNGGNVVNMGTINAQNVTLQGNKVMLSADTSWDDKNNKIKFNQITADNIDLKGNEVYVDISTINSKNLTTEAKNKGIAYLSATGYYYNPTREYNDIVFTTKGVMDKTYNQYISIGSDLDWWHFAKGWNEKADFRNNVAGNTFKLTNNIDFKASSGQNYANYWIDLNGDGKKDANEFTNMIVGFKDDSAFTKTFDGQGYTLKNININTVSDEVKNKPRYVGLFGKADGANFKNIIIDYKNGGINAKGINDYIRVGGFIGEANGGKFENILLKNLNLNAYTNMIYCEKITSNGYCEANSYVGGFVGNAINNANFNIIKMDTISVHGAKSNPIYGSPDGYALLDYIHVGGFAGGSLNSNFYDIKLNNISKVSNGYTDTRGLYVDKSTGGFIGKADGGEFKEILLKVENIDGSYDASFSGGFVGWVYDKGSIFSHINSNINEVKGGNTTGGFAGYAHGGEFSNIKSNVNVVYGYTVGGFLGKIYLNSKTNKILFNNIELNNIDLISGYNAGGFLGEINNHNSNDVTFENIHIKRIEKIQGNYIYTGGFAGYIPYGVFKNISIDYIGEIYGESNVGGFAGYIGNGKFENISINNINKMTIIDDEVYNDIYAGGFAGVIKQGIFSNIVLNDIGGFVYRDNSSNSNNYFLYVGSFAGMLGDKYSSGKPYNLDFNNIYIFTKENFGVDSNKNNFFFGKIFGGMKNANSQINNVNIYHQEGGLQNAISDQDYWDKYKIITYNDKNTGKEHFKNDVSKIDGLIYNDGKFIFTKDFVVNSPSDPKFDNEKPLIPNIEDIISKQVTLDENDILDLNILNQIIADLKDKFYLVDINILNELLKAYANIDKNNPTSKAEFLANYFLSKDKYPNDEKRLEIAHSMIQSLDFLLAYANNNTGNSKLTADANSKYLNNQNLSENKSKNIINKNKELMKFIDKDLKPLVESSNKALDRLKIIQGQLKTAIAKYNDYVKKINENPAIKNEETLNALKAKVDILNQLSGELATTIANNQIQLEAWQDKASTDSNEHFTIKGQFDNVALLIPDLEKVTANGNENDDYEKISRQVANLQKQTPIFEYEDEETEEVDETSLAQKNKTCIVSDNYKTMNPCVAGM
ncbi:hypothetical protein QTU61_001605 [Campylobacter lari]|nr:hypothetical protein [Campylobacter lari]